MYFKRFLSRVPTWCLVVFQDNLILPLKPTREDKI